MADDLEQRLLDLQEEFQALQDSANEIEQQQEFRISELEKAIHRLQHSNDSLILEKLELQVPLLKLAFMYNLQARSSEKDDEIRYLQEELESALSDRQKDVMATEAARLTSSAAISCIQRTLEVTL